MLIQNRVKTFRISTTNSSSNSSMSIDSSNLEIDIMKLRPENIAKARQTKHRLTANLPTRAISNESPEPQENLRLATIIKLPKLQHSQSAATVTALKEKDQENPSQPPPIPLRKQFHHITQFLNAVKEESEPNTPQSNDQQQEQQQQIQPTKSRFAPQPLIKVSFDSANSHSSNSSGSSDCSEFNIWDEDEINVKGIHIGEIEQKPRWEQFQTLYKMRYSTYPNARDPIDNNYVYKITQLLAKKSRYHWLKLTEIQPLKDSTDYTKPYQINDDQNYLRFWMYYQNKLNHRRHKNVPLRSPTRLPTNNPLVKRCQVRSNRRISATLKQTPKVDAHFPY